MFLPGPKTGLFARRAFDHCCLPFSLTKAKRRVVSCSASAQKEVSLTPNNDGPPETIGHVTQIHLRSPVFPHKA